MPENILNIQSESNSNQNTNTDWFSAITSAVENYAIDAVAIASGGSNVISQLNAKSDIAINVRELANQAADFQYKMLEYFSKNPQYKDLYNKIIEKFPDVGALNEFETIKVIIENASISPDGSIAIMGIESARSFAFAQDNLSFALEAASGTGTTKIEGVTGLFDASINNENGNITYINDKGETIVISGAELMRIPLKDQDAYAIVKDGKIINLLLQTSTGLKIGRYYVPNALVTEQDDKIPQWLQISQIATQNPNTTNSFLYSTINIPTGTQTLKGFNGKILSGLVTIPIAPPANYTPSQIIQYYALMSVRPQLRSQLSVDDFAQTVSNTKINSDGSIVLPNNAPNAVNSFPIPNVNTRIDRDANSVFSINGQPSFLNQPDVVVSEINGTNGERLLVTYKGQVIGEIVTVRAGIWRGNIQDQSILAAGYDEAYAREHQFAPQMIFQPSKGTIQFTVSNQSWKPELDKWQNLAIYAQSIPASIGSVYIDEGNGKVSQYNLPPRVPEGFDLKQTLIFQTLVGKYDANYATMNIDSLKLLIDAVRMNPDGSLNFDIVNNGLLGKNVTFPNEFVSIQHDEKGFYYLDTVGNSSRGNWQIRHDIFQGATLDADNNIIMLGKPIGKLVNKTRNGEASFTHNHTLVYEQIHYTQIEYTEFGNSIKQAIDARKEMRNLDFSDGLYHLHDIGHAENASGVFFHPLFGMMTLNNNISEEYSGWLSEKLGEVGDFWDKYGVAIVSVVAGVMTGGLAGVLVSSLIKYAASGDEKAFWHNMAVGVATVGVGAGVSEIATAAGATAQTAAYAGTVAQSMATTAANGGSWSDVLTSGALAGMNIWLNNAGGNSFVTTSIADILPAGTSAEAIAAYSNGLTQFGLRFIKEGDFEDAAQWGLASGLGTYLSTNAGNNINRNVLNPDMTVGTEPASGGFDGFIENLSASGSSIWNSAGDLINDLRNEFLALPENVRNSILTFTDQALKEGKNAADALRYALANYGSSQLGQWVTNSNTMGADSGISAEELKKINDAANRAGNDVTTYLNRALNSIIDGEDPTLALEAALIKYGSTRVGESVTNSMTPSEQGSLTDEEFKALKEAAAARGQTVTEYLNVVLYSVAKNGNVDSVMDDAVQNFIKNYEKIYNENLQRDGAIDLSAYTNQGNAFFDEYVPPLSNRDLVRQTEMEINPDYYTSQQASNITQPNSVSTSEEAQGEGDNNGNIGAEEEEVTTLSDRGLLNQIETTTNPDYYTTIPGTMYIVQSGDSLTSIAGTSDPQAIGAIMAANNMQTSDIRAGANLYLPSNVYSYGDVSALGQSALNQDNQRILAQEEAKREEAARIAAQQSQISRGSNVIPLYPEAVANVTTPVSSPSTQNSNPVNLVIVNSPEEEFGRDLQRIAADLRKAKEELDGNVSYSGTGLIYLGSGSLPILSVKSPTNVELGKVSGYGEVALTQTTANKVNGDSSRTNGIHLFGSVTASAVPNKVVTPYVQLAGSVKLANVKENTANPSTVFPTIGTTKDNRNISAGNEFVFSLSARSGVHSPDTESRAYSDLTLKYGTKSGVSLTASPSAETIGGRVIVRTNYPVGDAISKGAGIMWDITKAEGRYLYNKGRELLGVGN